MKTTRILIAAGVVLFWVAVFGFDRAGLPLVDAILLSVLLVVIPAFSVAQVPMIEGAQNEGAEIERLPAYWSSIGALWLVGAAAWLVGTRVEGAAGIGLAGMEATPFVLWSVGATVVALLLMFIFRAVSQRLGILDSRILAELLPQTVRERQVFGLLSFAAGFGEEFAYRGYAITMLAPVIGLGWAIGLSTVIFGVMHAYQGWFGIVRTTAMGGVLAGVFVMSGSLWPSIVAHVLIDLLAGLVLGERLLTRDE